MVHLPRQGRGRAGARAVLACALAIFGAAAARPAAGQVAQAAMLVEGDDSNDTQMKLGGFSVRKEDIKVTEALADFDRYVEKKAWDRAFKALEGVASGAQAGGMTPGKTGFFFPTKVRVFQSLVALPAPGKDAYRLFNDAKAKQQWEAVQAKEAAGDAEALAGLRKLVEQYFITSIGDVAADHLADALFEQADYVTAAQTWADVIAGFPDTRLSPVRLRVKQAVALARSRRWDRFDALLADVRNKFAGEQVKIGGRDVVAADYLASLRQSSTTGPATTRPDGSNNPNGDDGPLALPETDQPKWQMQFLDVEVLEKIAAQLANSGWGNQMGGMLRAVPAAATDGKRVYANWYGVYWAMDAQTGKLLWRTGKFSDLGDKFQELIQWGVDANRFSLTLAGNDTLLAVALRLDRLNNQEPFRLMCLSTADGKKKWGSDNGPLTNWGFVGPPTVVDGTTVYATAHPKESQDISLLSVNLADGKLNWSVQLGTPQTGNNYRGMPQYTIPSIAYQSGMVYVLTNNGALVAVDATSRAVRWAFGYEVPIPANQNYGYNQQDVLTLPGVVAVRDGVLYFKESNQRAMFAVDLSGPALAWRRASEQTDMLAGIDERNLYVVSRDFCVIDRQSLKMLSSTPLVPPGEMIGDRVACLRDGSRFYVMTPRGIRELDVPVLADPTRPVPTRRGADPGAIGGVLMRTGDAIVSVTNDAITAYPIRGNRAVAGP